ncbi:MAG: hypothetical protein E4H40_02265 [Candidatus Brocadiia bacterium]|nr:MAG: hypothetical protein E4H40_02265 [Candidatus Brocadiia bacterium]
MQTTERKQKNEKDVCSTDHQMVEIEEYALREGVSVKMVEDLVKMGVIKMRRSRGRSFVVDVPLSPYGTDGNQGREAELERSGHSNTVEDHVETMAVSQTTCSEDEQGDDNEVLERGVITQLVMKMLRKSTKVSEDDIYNEELAEACCEEVKAPVDAGTEEDDLVVSQARVMRHGPPRRIENLSTGGRRDMESCLYRSIPMTSSEAVEIINSKTTIADDLVERAKETNEYERCETIDTPELQARLTDRREFEGAEPAAGDKVMIDIDREFQKLIDEINNFDALPDPTEFLCSAAETKQQPKQQKKTAAAPLFKRLIRKQGNVTSEQVHKVSNRGDEKPVAISADMGVKLGMLTAQARSKTAWKIFGILSLAALFVTVCLLLWVYMDGKMSLTTTQERLDQAYTSVQKLYDDSSQAQQNAKQLQQQLENARARISEMQNKMLVPDNQFLTGLDNYGRQDQVDMIVKPAK